MSTSNTLNRDFTVSLRDGRAIGITVVGKADGFPIIHCHGSGSSRLEVRLFAAEAVAQGVRLIGLDRPGVGRSDAKIGYRLLDWPIDVMEIADQLDIERFAVEGVSAGGPYALACASAIPQRLTACGLISTLPPPSFIRKAGPALMRAMWWLGGQAPWLVLFYARQVQRMTGSDEASLEKYFTRYAPQLGAADQKLLSNPEFRKPLIQAMAESFRQGGDGNLEVIQAEIQSWGFEFEQITCEKLFMWHGEADRIMPIAPIRQFAQALPHCTAMFYPEEGHFSTAINHAQDILHTLSTQ